MGFVLLPSDSMNPYSSVATALAAPSLCFLGNGTHVRAVSLRFATGKSGMSANERFAALEIRLPCRGGFTPPASMSAANGRPSLPWG